VCSTAAAATGGGVTISPFWPYFWPSSFFFSHQVHTLLKVTLQESNKKHQITQDIPLVLNTTKRWGYLRKLLGRRVPTVNPEVHPQLIFRSIYRQVLPRRTSQRILSTIFDILRNRISLGTKPPVLSQYILSTWWFHVQSTNTFLSQDMLSSFRIH
jgi:hypothetical protein